MLDAPLSVVIPAYDEAARIGRTLDRVRAHLAEHHPGSEVLVVDDGSADETAARVEDAARAGSAAAGGDPAIRCLRQPSNRGKGAAVRAGVLAATRPYVLMSDADLSTPIEEVSRLLAAVAGGADVAIGSRALPGSRIEISQPLHRVVMGKSFNKLMRSVTFLGVIDSQCGFKLFPLEVAHRLFAPARIDGFAFDVEVLWLARRAGMRIAEVPVRWVNDPRSTVQPVRHSAQMLRDVLRIRWIHAGRRV